MTPKSVTATGSVLAQLGQGKSDRVPGQDWITPEERQAEADYQHAHVYQEFLRYRLNCENNRMWEQDLVDKGIPRDLVRKMGWSSKKPTEEEFWAMISGASEAAS